MDVLGGASSLAAVLQSSAKVAELLLWHSDGGDHVAANDNDIAQLRRAVGGLEQVIETVRLRFDNKYTAGREVNLKLVAAVKDALPHLKIIEKEFETGEKGALKGWVDSRSLDRAFGSQDIKRYVQSLDRCTMILSLRLHLDEETRPLDFDDKMDLDSTQGEETMLLDGPSLGDYPYLPLVGPNAIRLIEVEAGQGNDPIVVRIFSTPLESAPLYDALSYVWGNPNSTITISCNNFPLSITENLYWGVYRARSSREKTILWADAICINQRDPDERSNQVGFMGHIYQRARHVLVCMGDEAEPGGASNVLHLLAEAAARGVGRGSRNPQLLPHDPLRTDWRWKSLAQLMRRPWFSRAWVLQEVGMARRPVVLYGEVRFGYRELMKVVAWLNKSLWSTRFGIASLVVHRRWIDWSDSGRNGTTENALFDLVSHACLLSCQDPRDHVYAFLAHPMAQLEDRSGPIIRPDYERDVLELYKEVTVLFLRQVGLRALVVVEHTAETLDEPFPSWVVRWNVHDILNEISQLPSPFFSAGGPDISTESPVVDEDVMHLKAILVDTVSACFQLESTGSELLFVNADIHTQKLTVRDLLTAAVQHNTGRSPYGDNLDLRTLALGLTLCAGRPGCSPNRVIDVFTRLYERGLPGALQSAQTHQTEEEEDIGLLSSVISMYRGRKLVVTKRGGFGLVPRVTKTGDHVCIVRGLDVPLVLRSAAADESGKRRWRLVGESYVYGLMKGQGLEALKAGEVGEEDLSVI